MARKRMRNGMGAVIEEMLRLNAEEVACHIDVERMYAPGECHGAVAEGFEQKRREKVPELERLVGMSFEDIYYELCQFPFYRRVPLHSILSDWSRIAKGQ